MLSGMAIIGGLWEAGKFVWDICTHIKTNRKEDLKELGETLEQIGHALHATFEELERGQYPHGRCAAIGDYAQWLLNSPPKILDPADAKRLGELLDGAHSVERLFAELNSGELPKAELVKIDEASGKFLSASRLILH